MRTSAASEHRLDRFVGRLSHKYVDLIELIGNEAFMYLRRGGRLIVWRGSTPHNWFIEKKNGELLWHVQADMRIPDLTLFAKVCDSVRRICVYWGADSGLPESSEYRLLPPNA